jgi:uncharacterized protein YndB with AHSA1/START domain
MTTDTDLAKRELVLRRTLKAPRAAIFKAWTTPALLKQFFVPRPWTIAGCEIDLRPGGIFSTVMQDPDGNRYPNTGIFLEIVPDRKLVFTDALLPGWIPTGKPFMVAQIELDDAAGGGTEYVATARHWTEEATKEHVAMGFFEGWGQVADQLDELIAGRRDDR